MESNGPTQSCAFLARRKSERHRYVSFFGGDILGMLLITELSSLQRCGRSSSHHKVYILISGIHVAYVGFHHEKITLVPPIQ